MISFYKKISSSMRRPHALFFYEKTSCALILWYGIVVFNEETMLSSSISWFCGVLWVEIVVFYENALRSSMRRPCGLQWGELEIFYEKTLWSCLRRPCGWYVLWELLCNFYHLWLMYKLIWSATDLSLILDQSFIPSLSRSDIIFELGPNQTLTSEPIIRLSTPDRRSDMTKAF